MAIAIQIELDLLCLIFLMVIANQCIRSVNQKLNRVIFRNIVLGIIAALTLDIFWVLIDGRQFPGVIILNKLVNALFLSCASNLGCLWYLYVLECLQARLSRRRILLVMTPGIIMTILNLLSMKTGWVFCINSENVYIRGPLFWLQSLVSLGTLLVSLLHLVIRALRGDTGLPREDLRRLLFFYILPVAGTLAALPFPGMPGTWTCGAVSVLLIYMDAQDREIIRDGLTGLNNRKMLEAVYADYNHQISDRKKLVVFMLDLNAFKAINDNLGHTVGDEALMEVAVILRSSVTNLRGTVMRYGGDEFLILGFFDSDQEVQKFEDGIRSRFREWNEKNQRSYLLETSIGRHECARGEKLMDAIAQADEELYLEKKRLNVGR